MNSAPDGSIVRRRSPRPDLLAFQVKGKITKIDLEWMSSVTDDAMRSLHEIDMLIIMPDYEGLELGAAFDGYAAGVMARSVAHIRRYVVVGAPGIAEAMINMSGAILPIEARTFGPADEAAAWAFLAAPRPMDP